MFKRIFLTSAVCLMVSPSLYAGNGFGLKLGIDSVGSDEFSSGERFETLKLGASYHFNDFAEISMSAGTSMTDSITLSQIDTFINNFQRSNEVSEIIYEDTISVDSMYSVNVRFNIPFNENYGLFVSAGYQQLNIEGVLNTRFKDNEPASNPDEAFLNGASDCEITGIESFCGNSLSALKFEESFSGFVGEAGLFWNVSEKISIYASYNLMSDEDVNFSSVSVGVNFIF